MKNSILSLCIVAVLFMSCNKTNKKELVVSAQNNTTNKVAVETTSDTTAFDGTNCFSSEDIYGATAFIWQESWVAYYNEFKPIDHPYEDSPKISFNGDVMTAINSYFKSREGGNKGVLISYVSQGDGSNNGIPGLAIQTAGDCTPNDGIIYVSYEDGTNGPISADNLAILKNNWADYTSDLDSDIGGVTLAAGYMYGWDSFSGAALELGISISFGLRTLEPDEVQGFEDSDALKTGSVIYCNIMYIGTNEANITEGSISSAPLSDFAKPCPTYCHIL